jgi:membrane AbrB-like protein
VGSSLKGVCLVWFYCRVMLTLLLAWAAATACVWLKTPIPWMLGPLVMTAGLSVLGGPTASALPLRNAGQWTIGAALGLYFTPLVGQMVAGLWWVIALGVVWALMLGWLGGVWMLRANRPHMPALERSTAYFGCAIGGASEMTLLSERHGAQTDLVASAHSVRVLVVTLMIPFAMQFSGVHDIALSPATVREVHWPLLGLMAVLTACGIALMLYLKRANPWFIGALLASTLLTLTGQPVSAIPVWLSNVAQLVIGVSLGVRFTPHFLHTAPRWLSWAALTTLAMIALCALFAWGLSRLTGLHVATLVLATSPGGIAEMAITAKVLQLGVPVVTAFQVCRLVAVLLLVEPLFVRLQRATA